MRRRSARHGTVPASRRTLPPRPTAIRAAGQPRRRGSAGSAAPSPRAAPAPARRPHPAVIPVLEHSPEQSTPRPNAYSTVSTPPRPPPARPGTRSRPCTPARTGPPPARRASPPRWPSALSAAAVPQPQPPVGEHRRLQHPKLPDRFPAAHPACRVDQDPLAGRRGGGAEGFRNRPHHLQYGRTGRGAQSEIGMHAARGEHEQGAGLVPRKAGHVRPVAGQQPDAASSASFGIDRHAGMARSRSGARCSGA